MLVTRAAHLSPADLAAVEQAVGSGLQLSVLLLPLHPGHHPPQLDTLAQQSGGTSYLGTAQIQTLTRLS